MEESSLVGHLLVATPMLEDPNFRRSVVFVIDSTAGEGTLGVVVNRPSELSVDEVVPGWAEYASDPAVMFAGGPVGTGSGLALGGSTAQEAPLGWRPLSGLTEGSPVANLGLVDLDAPVEILGDALDGLRVFAGYAGWDEGQLQAEIDEGAWYVLPAMAEDVFSGEPTAVWQRVLRRQGGDLALVATFPEDPSMN